MQSEVKIIIEHNGGDELYEKLGAIQTLVGTLTHEELMFLSTTIEEKPEILAELRPLLTKEDMSWWEMIGHAKRFYRMFKGRDPKE